MMIYPVLSHFDFVAKFTVTNLNKDFTNTIRGVVSAIIDAIFNKKNGGKFFF